MIQWGLRVCQYLHCDGTVSQVSGLALLIVIFCHRYSSIKCRVVTLVAAKLPNHTTAFGYNLELCFTGTRAGLQPFTEYSCQVQAGNSAGFGEWSDSAGVRTAASSPSAPVKLQAQGPAAILGRCSTFA